MTVQADSSLAERVGGAIREARHGGGIFLRRPRSPRRIGIGSPVFAGHLPVYRRWEASLAIYRGSRAFPPNPTSGLGPLSRVSRLPRLRCSQILMTSGVRSKPAHGSDR